jgi:hypothetical protein
LSTRRFYALFAVLCAIAIAQVVLCERLPGVDWPTHLAHLRFLRLWFVDRARFDALFGARPLQPYWAMYAPALLLSSVISVEHAARVMAAAGMLGVPLAALRLVRSEGADPLAALLALPLAFSLNFWWGFVPFLDGLALALLALPFARRFADGRASPLALAAWSIGICLGHGTVWLLFAIWLAWLLQDARAPLRRWLHAGLALAPALAFLAWYRAQLPPEVTRETLWHPLGTKLWSLAHVPFLAGDGALEIALVLLFFAGVALACIGERERGRMRRWGGLAALMLALWLALPHCLGGLSFLYQRFLTPFQFFLIPCAATRIRRRALFVTGALALFALDLGASAKIFRAHDRDTRDLEACLSRAEPGATMIGLIGKRAPDGVGIPLYLHADNWFTYERFGRVYSHSMEQLAVTPVYFRTPAFPQPLQPGLEWQPWLLDWAREGRGTRYFLLHDLPDAALKEGARHMQLVCREGGWRLFENLAR